MATSHEAAVRGIRPLCREHDGDPADGDLTPTTLLLARRDVSHEDSKGFLGKATGIHGIPINMWFDICLLFLRQIALAAGFANIHTRLSTQHAICYGLA
jgi:hypothetical protein